MLGRHQQTSPEEKTLVTLEWKNMHQWHTHEKRRLKRAMNKRMRQSQKLEVNWDTSLVA